MASKNQNQEEFLKHYAACGVVKIALDKAKITDMTLRRWRRDPDFRVRYHQAQDLGLDVLEERLIEDAIDGPDGRLRLQILSRRRPERWGDPTKRVVVSNLDQLKDYLAANQEQANDAGENEDGEDGEELDGNLPGLQDEGDSGVE